MNFQNIQGDIIQDLPTDSSVPSHNEVQVINQLFKENQSKLEEFFTKSKDLVILGILYVLFSLDYTDELIKKFILPSNNSSFILIGIKTLLFIVLYFFISNFYLAKK